MYVTPRQKRKNTIRILLLVVGLPFTVFAAYMVTRLVSNAGQDTEPTEVVKSNITSSSITISWLTGRKTTGSILIDQGGEEVTFPDQRGSVSSQTHYIEVTDLDPATTYNFKILSGGTEYGTSEGSTLSFKTLPVSTEIPVPNPVFGNTESEVTIFAIAKDASNSTVISTISGDTGSWYLDLSTFRKSDGSPIDTIEADDDLLFLVQSGEGGAEISGTFNALFDDDGMFVDEFTISADLYAIDYIPESATLLSLSEIVDDTDTSDDTNTDTPDDTDVPDDDEQPDDTDTPVDDTPNQPGVIASDISWENLVTTTTTVVSTPDVTTGEDSIEIVSLTDASATIIWLTEDDVEGSVEYGVDSTALSDDAVDMRDSLVEQNSYNSHVVELTNLLPNTKYYFSVNSGSDVYDNGENLYSFTTFETLDTPPPYTTITGSVDGVEDDDVVVLSYTQNNDSEGSDGVSQTAVGIVDQNGNWNISLGDLRTEDGADYFSISDGDNIVTSVLVYGNSEEVTTIGSDVEDASVEIAVSDAETTTTSTSGKVALLTETEYRVYESEIPYGIGGGGDDIVYDPDSGASGETPATGLFDNSWIMLGTAGSLVLAGIVWSILQGNRSSKSKKGSSSMKSML